MPTSNIISPIWKSTSEIYGGTPDFKNGALDDIINFLNGKNNEKLPGMFSELLQRTARMIAEIRDANPEEEKVLIRLFEFQLRLFYNVLGCQNREVLKASADNLKQVLDLILELLQFLKRFEIIFSDKMKEYIKILAEKVKEIPLLNEHFIKIIEDKLI